MLMIDENTIETQTHPAARAAVIARALADNKHRSIAFTAGYLALTDPNQKDVVPVVQQLLEYRYAPHLAPLHLRRLAGAVHMAIEIAGGGRPNVASLSAAGLAAAVRDWMKIAQRL